MSVTISEFVTARLESFRDRTSSWGAPETVEMLALQLLELEARELYPDRYEADPRIAIDLFIRYLEQTDPAGLATPLHLSVPEIEFGRTLFDACSRVRARLAGERKGRPASRRGAEVDLAEVVSRSVANVRNDARGDWLRDPWEWPELHDSDAASKLALELACTRAYSEPMLVDVAKSPTATRPGLQLPPIDRVLYQAIIDDVSVSKIGDLSPNVFGWRLARDRPKPGMYNNNSREWRLHRARRHSLLQHHTYCLHVDVRDFFECVRVDSLLSSLPSGHAHALERMFSFWKEVTPRRGLPQRSLASAVLAHVYLRSLDRALEQEGRVKWCRWMDDVTVTSNSYSALTDCLATMQAVLSSSGLAVNVGKTKISESIRVEEPTLSGVESNVFPFKVGDIDRPKLTDATAAALEQRDEISRSVISFLARRVRLVRDVELGRSLMTLADSAPFAADLLARMCRELDFSGEYTDWYLQYARVHPAASDWSVAAWAMLFRVDNTNPRKVADFFSERLTALPPTAVLRPACAAHAANEIDGIDRLRSCLPGAQSALSIRPLILALAQAGYSPNELKGLLPSSLNFAVERVAAGARSWEFRSASA